MRKFAALMCLLALALAACSIQINLPAGKPASQEPVQTETALSTTQAPTEAPTEAPTQPETEQTWDMEILGTYEDGTYTNTVLGIQGAFDQRWYIATQEERLALQGAALEMISDEDLAKLMQDAGCITVFYARINGTGDNVNIGIEKLGLWLGDAEVYLEASMENLRIGLESMGLTDVTVESAPYTIDGVEYAGARVHGLLEGVDFYERMVCIRAGQYMGILTAASYAEDLTEEFLAQFHRN